jgi:hypothetical protein
MFRNLSPIVLILWATCSNAVIQNGDFWFHDEGDTIFIDGKRGAPLHIDYIGAKLTKPLTIKVTPNNPKLKIAAQICTFTKKNNECRLVVHNAKEEDKVYGVNHFTITEVIEGSQSVLNPRATSNTSTVGFGVGVRGKDMPKPFSWWPGSPAGGTTDALLQDGPVIVANSTSQTRDYQSPFYTDIRDKVGSKTPIFTLPPGRICYLDQSLCYNCYKDNRYYPLSKRDTSKSRIEYISDMTNPHEPIYNGPIYTGNNNITTCSADGEFDCASNKWDSWTVGLANLSSSDLDSDVFKAGQIQILQNNTWDNGTTLYYRSGWYNSNIALLLIQGSVDGSRFDPNAAAPNLQEIKSAPPCSNYIKGDPSVTFTVRLKIFGPGSVSMPAGAQCQSYRTPGEDFTNCTGSGSKDTFYEITAIPEVGKTFKGWSSDGLCDDSKTTCRFPLTRDVRMKPYFW